MNRSGVPTHELAPLPSNQQLAYYSLLLTKLALLNGCQWAHCKFWVTFEPYCVWVHHDDSSYQIKVRLSAGIDHQIEDGIRDIVRTKFMSDHAVKWRDLELADA